MEYKKQEMNFEQIYDDQIVPFLGNWEKKRINRNNIFKFLLFISAVVLGIIIFLIKFDDSVIPVVFVKLILFVIFFLFLLSVYWYLCFSSLGKQMKKQILPKILRCFGEFGITKNDTMPVNVIKNYNLWNSVDKKNNDDIIVGQYKGVDITIQESKIYGYTGARQHINLYFNGLIIKVKSSKQFLGTTVLRPKYTNLNPLGVELIKIDKPEFEELYGVYSSIPEDAMQLLTPELLENLKKIRKRFVCTYPNYLIKRRVNPKIIAQYENTDDMEPVFCVFDKGEIIIFIPLRNYVEDWFEVFHPFNTVFDVEIYKRVFVQITKILDTINDIVSMDKTETQ